MGISGMERYFLEFETTPPGDELGEGRALMVKLRDELQRRGVSPTHDVSSWEGYGWTMAFEVGSRTLECMLQRSDNWLLMSWVEIGFLDRLRGVGEPEEAAFLRSILAEAVRTIANQPNPRWQTARQFHSQSRSE